MGIDPSRHTVNQVMAEQLRRKARSPQPNYSGLGAVDLIRRVGSGVQAEDADSEVNKGPGSSDEAPPPLPRR